MSDYMGEMTFGNDKFDDTDPIPVKFPLKGEWMTLNTPGHKIPSHGIDQFGQRFAYDFLTPYDMELATDFKAALRYWFGGGIPLSQTTSQNAEILAPLSGKIIAAKDGWPEKIKASPLDILAILALSFGLRGGEKTIRKDYRMLAGNYIIIEGKDCFAFLAHASTGSVRVNEGDHVEPGRHIANVGHTGNSSQPHLHFHLMDSPDLSVANGLPCCFEEYEQLIDGNWKPVKNGIPGKKDKIRATS